MKKIILFFIFITLCYFIESREIIFKVYDKDINASIYTDADGLCRIIMDDKTDNIKNTKAADSEPSGLWRSEPSGIWYYPDFHRFHTVTVVLNVKPVNRLTITPSFVFATGVPEYTFGKKEMFLAYSPEGTELQMYTRKKIYNDFERTDFHAIFNLRIALNFFIPKSKLKFEAYLAVEDLFKIFYNPKSGIETNIFTGEDQETAEANFNLTVPMPSIGIKLDF